jgi:glucose-specific phosphotransferase system IIA component
MASLSPTVDQSTPAINLVLYAPLSGVLVPIERVPDPVFAQKMAGDGIALDPISQSLLAPCDGEVVQLHSAHHALATAAGIEVMPHIGLDTITLKGQGFTPCAKLGDRVRAGDPLIDFDADYLATHARSLLTMMVVTSGDRVATFDRRSCGVTALYCARRGGRMRAHPFDVRALEPPVDLQEVTVRLPVAISPATSRPDPGLAGVSAAALIGRA